MWVLPESLPMYPNLIMEVKMLRSIVFFCFSLLTALSLCSCHHGIKAKELEYPPEYDETGVSVSTKSPEEVETELKRIAEMPIPPYTIQPGDAFRIKVYGEEDLTDGSSTANTMVTPDGYVVLTLLGPVFVKDLSIVDATEKVTKAYEKFVRYPQVALIPVRINGKKVSIFGAVNKPGTYMVTDNMRISDIFADAGGASTGLMDGTVKELANIPGSYIIRNGAILPVNFTEAIYKGNPLHNIKVFPEDIIYIAQKENSRVTLMGEVKNPRQINWEANMTLIDAIAQAGGLTDEHWKNVLILRKTKEADPGTELKVYKVNINDLYAGRGRNFTVAAEDIIYAPKDAISEYNVFIKKLLPTAQLINAFTSPIYWFYK